MIDHKLTQIPITKTGMLIRRPVTEVFEAFVNPAITTQFTQIDFSQKSEQSV